ncbi:unnamed protein product [Haemonchus placei]|uniref:Ovule protein n=1 Tax=Haemonchus placei TaxID=6290 RepID=A0A0N4XAF2_HAEPC|nr:unnamed protein product [Haemonchus placei]
MYYTCTVSLFTTYEIHSSLMYAVDGSESRRACYWVEPKMEKDEDRYRLKIAVLQDYYDAVALVSFRCAPRCSFIFHFLKI